MPSTKLIAFRLRDDHTYARRYASLVERIKAENTTRVDEFTSLFFLYHVDNAQVLFDRLLHTSEIYLDGTDMLFVIDLNTQERAHIGIINPSMLDFVLSAGANAPRYNALGSGNLAALALMGSPRA